MTSSFRIICPDCRGAVEMQLSADEHGHPVLDDDFTAALERHALRNPVDHPTLVIVVETDTPVAPGLPLACVHVETLYNDDTPAFQDVCLLPDDHDGNHDFQRLCLLPEVGE